MAMSDPMDANSRDFLSNAQSRFYQGDSQTFPQSQSSPDPEPIESIELPPPENVEKEGEWLRKTLLNWLDTEFLPEIINQHIAARASEVFVRQRMEGENNLNALVLAILTEMQGYDFSKSFYSEFAVANAVGDLLLESLGIERCCGN